MSLPRYPREEVDQIVMDTFIQNDIGLRLQAIEVFDKSWSRIIQEEKWVYVFKAPDSNNVLKFNFLFPSYGYCFLLIENQGKSFVFGDYLTSIKSNEFKDHKLFSDTMRGDEKNNWSIKNYLAMIDQHLKTDLKLVAMGKEWIDVPFDWESIGR